MFEERVRAIQDKKEIEAKIAMTNKVEEAPAAPSRPSKNSSTTDRGGRTVNVEVKRNIKTETKN